MCQQLRQTDIARYESDIRIRINDCVQKNRTNDKKSRRLMTRFELLVVRSLANASRVRQFNPLNPPGVGWVKLKKN